MQQETMKAGNDEGEGEVTPEGCCHNFIDLSQRLTCRINWNFLSLRTKSSTNLDGCREERQAEGSLEGGE